MNKTPTQILYEQHLAKFGGDKEKLIKHHSDFLESYKNGKEERSAHTDIKARLLTNILKLARNEN